MKTNFNTQMGKETEPSQEHVVIRFLDRLVIWTGIPKLTEQRIRRRPLKVIPLILVAINTIVIASVFAYPTTTMWKFFALDFCFMAGCLLQPFGPIKQAFNPNDFLDERDKEIKKNAYFFTYTSTTFAAIICMIAMTATATLSTLKREQVLWSLLCILIYIVSLLTTLPTLHASWVMPKAIEDDE